jgi:hypothetical protein
MALRTPERLFGYFGPLRPTRTSQVVRLLVGGTLSSQALVFLNAGDGFSMSIQAGIQLGSDAERHSQRRNRSALTE